MPSTNHSHSHSRTDPHPSTHIPQTTKKSLPQKSQPSPLSPQTTSKPPHDNNITDIVPASPTPTPPPPTTEATLCASIRLQSRLSDLLETAKLFIEFDDATKNSPTTYNDLTYFYHRDLRHTIGAVLRAFHQLADRIAEGIETSSLFPSVSLSPSSSFPSGNSEDAQKARDERLLALVPEAMREACLGVEREVAEVRERRKGVGREERRGVWRGCCEGLVRGVEGSKGEREREVERLRGSLRGEVGRMVGAGE